VGDELGRDGLGVRDDELGRPPPALGRRRDRPRVRRARPRLPEQLALASQRVGQRVVRPAAGRRQRDDRARASAGGELQRHVPAERVAGKVRRGEARRVHRALHRVGQRAAPDGALDRRPARVPGERRRQDVVPALEVRQDELPRAPRVEEAVQQHERRPGAAAVGGREH